MKLGHGRHCSGKVDPHPKRAELLIMAISILVLSLSLSGKTTTVDTDPLPPARCVLMLKSLLEDRSIHFLLLALAIFVVHGQIGGAKAPASESIVVSAPKIEQMAILFTKTWQRPPTNELKGLIDDYVKKRFWSGRRSPSASTRTIRSSGATCMKIEFLNAADAEVLEAADAELEALSAANPGAFVPCW